MSFVKHILTLFVCYQICFVKSDDANTTDVSSDEYFMRLVFHLKDDSSVAGRFGLPSFNIDIRPPTCRKDDEYICEICLFSTTFSISNEACLALKYSEKHGDLAAMLRFNTNELEVFQVNVYEFCFGLTFTNSNVCFKLKEIKVDEDTAEVHGCAYFEGTVFGINVVEFKIKCFNIGLNSGSFELEDHATVKHIDVKGAEISKL